MIVTVQHDTFVHEPTAVLDYGFIWTLFLDNAGGDTIATSVWSYEGDDAELLLENDTFQDGITAIWISLGTLKMKYYVTNTITTAAGRTAVNTFYIYIDTDTEE